MKIKYLNKLYLGAAVIFLSVGQSSWASNNNLESEQENSERRNFNLQNKHELQELELKLKIAEAKLQKAKVKNENKKLEEETKIKTAQIEADKEVKINRNQIEGRIQLTSNLVDKGLQGVGLAANLYRDYESYKIENQKNQFEKFQYEVFLKALESNNNNVNQQKALNQN